jgi:hypothetical protein
MRDDGQELRVKTKFDIKTNEEREKANVSRRIYGTSQNADYYRTEREYQNNPNKNDKFLFPPSNISYKYYIGNGNNALLVRSLFKNRYWWVRNTKEEMKKSHFCWT